MRLSSSFAMIGGLIGKYLIIIAYSQRILMGLREQSLNQPREMKSQNKFQFRFITFRVNIFSKIFRANTRKLFWLWNGNGDKNKLLYQPRKSTGYSNFIGKRQISHLGLHHVNDKYWVCRNGKVFVGWLNGSSWIMYPKSGKYLLFVFLQICVYPLKTVCQRCQLAFVLIVKSRNAVTGK